MVTFFEEFEAAYLQYLQLRVRLPYEKAERSGEAHTLVHASAIGRCPLATAKERNNEPERYPQARREKLSSLHLMSQGERDAEPIQEALVRFLGFKAEHYFQDRVAGVSGRVDAYKFGTIVEIKRRDAQRGRSRPMPKRDDMLQILAYINHFWNQTQVHHEAYLLMVNRYYCDVWQMEWNEGLSQYVLYDHDGEIFIPDGRVDSYTLAVKIAQHKNYLEDKNLRHTPEQFVDDFAAVTDGWNCYKWDGEPAKKYKDVYKGKTERRGKIKRRCVHWCHPFEAEDVEVRETSYESGKFEIVKEAVNVLEEDAAPF